MTTNRAQRRMMKANAKEIAARMARRCYDFHAGGGMVPVSNENAVAALARAFTLLLRFSGESVAVPISATEASGFPRWHSPSEAGGVTWLAVGLDVEGRGTYALQSAASPLPALAHDTAREKAMSNLATVCATSGFPMGKVRGRA